MTAFRSYLADKIQERKNSSLYRSRRIRTSEPGPYVDIDKQRYLNFSSNDYLGLSRHPDVVEALKQGADTWGVGSGSSHLMAGHTAAHSRLEEIVADFTGRERALVFSSGYMANLGLLGALAGRKDALFMDRLCHASLIDAARLCRARLTRFPHRDAGRLAALLTESRSSASYLVTDTVFSMDGDMAPLDKYSRLCRDNGAVLIADDAHGFGVLGNHGEGSVGHFNLDQDDLPVLIGTFGKACGVSGAFVAGSDELIDTLVQYSRTYIYTTAMPPAVAEAVIAGISLVRSESWRREKLRSLIAYFRRKASQRGLRLLPSDTAIQPVMIGSAEQALEISNQLEKNAVLLSAIRPPTVPRGAARLRITLTADHQEKHIDRLLSVLDRMMR